MSVLAPMPCVEFVEQVNDYLEGALPEVDHARLEAHLEECPHCVEYLDQLRVVRDRAGSLTGDDITPRLRDDLMRAFTQWRDES